MRKKFKVLVNGKEYVVEIEELGGEQHKIASVQPVQPVYPPQVHPAPQKTSSPVVHDVGEGAVTAPMPGKILDIRVNPGDKVKMGQVLVILEAMKMENEIVAPKDGMVKEIRVNVGDNVDREEVLVVIG